MVEYATTRNNSETARTFGMAESTIRKVIKDNPEEYKLCEQKVKGELQAEAILFKQEFMRRAEESIKKAIDLSNQRLELALVSHEKFDDRIDDIMAAMREGGADYASICDMVKSLASVMSVPLKDLSTFIGTLYDKRSLANGEATCRTDVQGEVKNINEHTYTIYEEIKSDPELTDLYKQLYRRKRNLEAAGER